MFFTVMLVTKMCNIANVDDVKMLSEIIIEKVTKGRLRNYDLLFCDRPRWDRRRDVVISYQPFHDYLLSVKSIKQATFGKNEKFLIFKSVANIGHQLKCDINTNCLQNPSPTST